MSVDQRPSACSLRFPKVSIKRLSTIARRNQALMSHSVREYLTIPEPRRAAIRDLDREFVPGRKVALSTHMNADGDGCGSQVALARMLTPRGLDVRVVNPTPWPALFGYLLGDDVKDMTSKGSAALKGIDLLIVLDISDVKRLG